MEHIKFILLGAALVVATVMIHTVGTTAWLKVLSRRELVTEYRGTAATMRLLGSTVLVLLLLHAIEIELWAAAYLFLLPPDVLSTVEEASYFSFVTFTTLGYGDITLEPPLRIMSGIEAMNGIILGGWSTAMLFAVVQRSWQVMIARDASNT